jgi:CDP-diglyceride synthetase
VGEDLVSMFGFVKLGEDVSIGKDMVAMFGGLSASSTVSVRGDTVVQPAWIFWTPLVIFIVVIILVVHEFRSYRRRAYLRNYPFPPPPPPHP